MNILSDLFREIREREMPPAGLEAALRGQFRAHHSRRKTRRIAAVAALAACLTIVFAMATMAVRKSLRPSIAAAPAPVPATVPQRVAAQAPETVATVRKAPAPKRRPVRAAAPARNVEVMTGFLPVGLSGFGQLDGGSLVRVGLPRSALAAFGLPVNENRYLEVVQADVLLGEDGVARAIRFIQ